MLTVDCGDPPRSLGRGAVCDRGDGARALRPGCWGEVTGVFGVLIMVGRVCVRSPPCVWLAELLLVLLLLFVLMGDDNSVGVVTM
jgi:hypothetical protein